MILDFPMPDYDPGETGVVKVTIPGRVIDEKYTRMQRVVKTGKISRYSGPWNYRHAGRG